MISDMQMDTIASKTSKTLLNFNASVKLSASEKNRLKKAIVAALDVCGEFALKNGKRHGLGLSGVSSLQLSMNLCGTAKIKSLNSNWRNKDYATDVLSFPVHDDLRGNDFPLPPDLELGDLFVCHQIAIKQAKEYEVTWEQEIVHLYIHGFLHLLGFDHELSHEEEVIMQKHEQNLVKKAYQLIGWGKNG
ncbi:MAG: rRNA maturation RNase YbeY [Halobacteriovorax sp.]|nr:rRNA maturation RNase YbeY [Halobacteriovorax sp.]